jgi:hypothetical protein
MSAVLERRLAAGLSEKLEAGGVSSSQNIAVIFTTIESTLSALREAAVLASQLDAHLTLIVPQVVRNPFLLTTRPTPLDRRQKRFHVVAGQCSVETSVRVCSCRSPEMLPQSALDPHSLVVIGRPRTWWPTREGRMARKLRRAGFEVIFAKAKSRACKKTNYSL